MSSSDFNNGNDNEDAVIDVLLSSSTFDESLLLLLAATPYLHTVLQLHVQIRIEALRRKGGGDITEGKCKASELIIHKIFKSFNMTTPSFVMIIIL